jgi:large subunit ribosomal protein L12e
VCVVQEKNIKHTGSIPMDQIIEIARIMRSRSCAKNLSGTVKEILGTCVSVGCNVDGESPRDVQEQVCSCGDMCGGVCYATVPTTATVLQYARP